MQIITIALYKKWQIVARIPCIATFSKLSGWTLSLGTININCLSQPVFQQCLTGKDDDDDGDGDDDGDDYGDDYEQPEQKSTKTRAAVTYLIDTS